MGGRAASPATDRSGARGCRSGRRRQSRRSRALAVTDRIAPERRATKWAEQQHSLRDAEIGGGEASCKKSDAETARLADLRPAEASVLVREARKCGYARIVPSWHNLITAR